MMRTFVLLITLGIVVAIGVGLYLYLNKSESIPPQFSSYETMDATLLETASKEVFVPELIQYLFVSATPTYPTNDLKSEIKRLVAVSEQRSETVIVQHNTEYSDVLAIPVTGGQTLANFIGSDVRPLTNEIYRVFTNDIAVLIAQKKIQYNIARPVQINLAVNTPVETPMTPSYPSLFAAKATVAGEILSYFMEPEDYQKVATAINEAILRKQIVGVSTKFDTEYGEQLAKAYSIEVLNHERSQEFIRLIREKEWSGDQPWQPTNTGELLSNLKSSNIQVTHKSKNFLFNAIIENIGQAKTPERVLITLEIDRYNDGTVDKTIEFPVGAIFSGGTKEVGYSLAIDWPGTHSVRMIINKNLDFLETYHHDNYTGWTEFTIGE